MDCCIVDKILNRLLSSIWSLFIVLQIIGSHFHLMYYLKFRIHIRITKVPSWFKRQFKKRPKMYPGSKNGNASQPALWIPLYGYHLAGNVFWHGNFLNRISNVSTIQEIAASLYHTTMYTIQ